MLKFTSAKEPNYDGKVPHLRCKKEDIADIVLLPGDPARVEKFGALCDNFNIISKNREFVVATGYFEGIKVSVCSTGIGAPSTEIAVVELISMGVRGLIRTGGTGVIQENIECGELIINTGAMRLGGSSIFYVKPEYPALASFEVVSSLKEASEKTGNKYHMGICASVGSFYKGQGRNIPGKDTSKEDENILNEYKKLNIINLEMEAETIFTLASLNNVYAGSICAVHCNRITDKWLIDYEEAQMNMCKTALKASVILKKNYIGDSHENKV